MNADVHDVGVADLFTVTAAGLPIALWAFLVLVTLASIGAAVRFMGRPASFDQGS